jgi:FkbM family methyltransferase
MTGATGNIYAGLHEFADMAFTMHFLRAGDTFVDIGANVGSYTILAAGVCGAITISFEPDPQTMEFLRRNVKLNGLESSVSLNEVALGSHEGTVDFTVGLDTVNRVVSLTSGTTRKVRQDTLDSMLSSTPSMIKIDVEGYESSVFKGAERTLSCPSLKAIITEGQDSDVIHALTQARFAHYKYDPFNRTLERATGLVAGNALFIRDFGFVSSRVATAKKIIVLAEEV